ncbi:MAG TPA: hypothetical protein VF622_05720 [Segetibacter sp.]|jgi:hypothetical protein
MTVRSIGTVNFTPFLLLQNIILIERSDSLQVETDTVNGSVIKNKIVWKGACDYEIVSTSTNSKTKDNIDSFFARTPIKVKILGGNKDYYVFNARIDSANRYVEFKDTMRVVE